jgi:1-acyl-sn-glycerol-3-phosphate acyltransferase
MTFADNKKRFSYTFFSGSPGIMRARVHKFIETKDKKSEDRKIIKEETRAIILEQLHKFNP